MRLRTVGCESSAQQWAGELLTKDGLSGCEAGRPPGPTLPWTAAGLPMNSRQERRRETDSRTSGSGEAQGCMRGQAFPLDPTLQGQLPPAGRRPEERILPIWILGDPPVSSPDFFPGTRTESHEGPQTLSTEAHLIRISGPSITRN